MKIRDRVFQSQVFIFISFRVEQISEFKGFCYFIISNWCIFICYAYRCTICINNFNGYFYFAYLSTELKKSNYRLSIVTFITKSSQVMGLNTSSSPGCCCNLTAFHWTLDIAVWHHHLEPKRYWGPHYCHVWCVPSVTGKGYSALTHRTIQIHGCYIATRFLRLCDHLQWI